MRLKYGSVKNPVVVYFSSYDDGAVTVEDNNRDYKRTVREDAGGKFFTWNKVKYYLNNFIKVPMIVLEQRISNGEFVTDDDLYQSIKTDGVANVRFEVPMSVVSARGFGLAIVNPNNRINLSCKINEDSRYSIDDGYKINLIPADSNVTDDVTSETFYLLDFISSIRSGYIKILSSVA